jgi:hypothetical protein
MEKIGWTDSVKNGDVLYRVKEEMNVCIQYKEGRLTGMVISCRRN